MISQTQFVLIASFMGLALTACQPMTDNSLLTDKKDEASTLTVDKTPKSEELYVKLNTTTIAQAVTASKLEIGGECYVSTYPTHRILAYSGSTQLDIYDISEATPDPTKPKQALCRNGRFNFSLNMVPLTVGVQYTVRVAIQAFDGTGALVTNDVQGAATIKFTKSN